MGVAVQTRHGSRDGTADLLRWRAAVDSPPAARPRRAQRRGRRPARRRGGCMTVFPGYTLPSELSRLREQIRRIVQDEIVPIEQRIDPDAADIPEEDQRRLCAKTKAAGLWCLGAPEEYGGGGLDSFSMCVVLEEMAQHRMGLYNPGCGVFGRYPPPVIYGGTPEQIRRYAVPTIRDGLHTFFAITEPSGGSDPARAIRTRAVRDGDSWVLNGSKIFISH